MNRAAQQHLTKAADYLERGDKFYAKAADEIIAAQKADPTLGYRDIGERFGKSKDWARDLVTWRTSGEPERPIWRRGSHGTTKELEQIATERPSKFVAAYEAAPPEARREIARQISRSPEIRVEAAKRDRETTHTPTPVSRNDDLTIYQFESKLASAYGALKQAFELLSDIDQPGDSQAVLTQLARLQLILEIVTEAYKSGDSIDTWAHQLWEEAK